MSPAEPEIVRIILSKWFNSAGSFQFLSMAGWLSFCDAYLGLGPGPYILILVIWAGHGQMSSHWRDIFDSGWGHLPGQLLLFCHGNRWLLDILTTGAYPVRVGSMRSNSESTTRNKLNECRVLFKAGRTSWFFINHYCIFFPPPRHWKKLLFLCITIFKNSRFCMCIFSNLFVS